MSHEAIALIRLRGEAVLKGCCFLFPGDVPGQPVVDLKRFWERMSVQAEIPDVRIHDLRHTFASLLGSGGASLETIGRLLSHTEIGTTKRYAKPGTIRVDNGPEYISGKLLIWAEKRGITIQHIQPGQPQQNAYIERYNRTVRHEWLDQYIIETIEEAQDHATQWLWTYNNDRPNMGIGGITPAQKLKMAA